MQVEYDGLLRKTNLTTEKSNRLSLEAMGDYFFCDISNIFSNILITVKTAVKTDFLQISREIFVDNLYHQEYTKLKHLNNRSNVQ